MVMVEAAAISPEGLISPGDSGMWSDEHAAAFSRITRFIAQQIVCRPYNWPMPGVKPVEKSSLDVIADATPLLIEFMMM